jgi:hypothetical protein
MTQEQAPNEISLDIRLIRLIHDIQSEPKFDARVALVRAVLHELEAESEAESEAIQAMRHTLRMIHEERFQQLRIIGEIMKLLEFLSCQHTQSHMDLDTMQALGLE